VFCGDIVDPMILNNRQKKIKNWEHMAYRVVSGAESHTEYQRTGSVTARSANQSGLHCLGNYVLADCTHTGWIKPILFDAGSHKSVPDPFGSPTAVSNRIRTSE
jgi:hypothetical protein